MATEILSLDEIVQSQANKYVTHNTALRQIEAILVRAISRTNSGPPGSPSNGNVYIVDTASGDWSTASVNDIAHYYSGAWAFYTPTEGWRLWVNDENAQVVFDGSSWVTEYSKFQLKNWSETTKTVASSGSSTTVTHASANVYDITLDADCSITFAGAPISGVTGTFTIFTRQNGVGGWDIFWPSGVQWASSVVPVAASASSAVAFWEFKTVDNGTIYYGRQLGQNMG